VRVAVFHNRYALRGGEDAVVELEMHLLRKAGCEVHGFFADSAELRSPLAKLRTALAARESAAVAGRVAAFLARHPVDVGHVHNFFPLLTPAVHATLARLGIPVVQTLHNYRLLCANGLFLRRGLPCEECVAEGPWHAVRHACYRGSRLQTAVWADFTAHHRARGTWLERVDRFVVPGAFAARKLVGAGLPGERVVVKPNPVVDPGEPAWGGHGAVYAGRLSPEKGVGLLLDAWRELEGHPLLVLGGGPEEAALRRRAAGIAGVRFAGEVAPEAVRAALRRAAFAVAPSLAYENFPLAVAEALAAGRPVVVPRGTALADMVEHGRTGLHFDRGDAASLAQACRRLARDAEWALELGREARGQYEETLAPRRATERLLEVYRGVLG
jgi:glycosyltransferase involved in cell wall biosynthesis